jgi:hypothetical protein
MLTMVASTDWASFAIAIGGAAVGIAGVAFGWLTSKGERETTVEIAAAQRQHDRELARDARLFGELRSAYIRLARVSACHERRGRTYSSIHGAAA